nr:NADH-quinone oxidoreductase subunit H [Blastocatellia bacterium]
GSINLYEIVEQQNRAYLPFGLFPVVGWIAFAVYLIAGIAESNRAPFDLPEAEGELGAGFHTEYSGFKWSMFFMAEYVNMFTVSVMCTVLFLGGWYVPGLSHLFEVGSIPYALVSHIAFIGKICAFLFFYIWVRGTLPRFRFDQLMNFGWKFLLPVAIANVIVTIVVVYFLNS